MGKLRDLTTQALIPLRAKHRLGRDPKNDTVFTHRAVSGDHAQILWREDHWVLRDLGTPNGTSVGARKLSGTQIHLSRGARIVLGDPSVALALVDNSPPEPFAIRADGLLVEGRDSELYLPQEEDFEAVILPEEGRSWSMTFGGDSESVMDGDQVRIAGSYWKLSLSSPPESTHVLNEQQYVIDETCLRFAVSRDEERVQLFALVRGNVIDLGRHAHHYTLLTMARRYQQDRRAGLLEPECGWCDLRELAQGLQVQSGTLRVQFHRAREGLMRKGWKDAWDLIGNRNAFQFRLGVRDTEIIREGSL